MKASMPDGSAWSDSFDPPAGGLTEVGVVADPVVDGAAVDGAVEAGVVAVEDELDELELPHAVSPSAAQAQIRSGTRRVKGGLQSVWSRSPAEPPGRAGVGTGAPGRRPRAMLSSAANPLTRSGEARKDMEEP
jgi:hypothetical protein